MNNPEVYDCFVEIVGDEDMRQQMVDIVSRDDGSGKWVDNNRREYGGYIANNTVIEVKPGEPSDDKGATIKIHEGYSTFHSHPSGVDSNSNGFSQPPSILILKTQKVLHHMYLGVIMVQFTFTMLMEYCQQYLTSGLLVLKMKLT